MRYLLMIGGFLGVIAGIIIIKILHLPVVVTIILVAGLVLGGLYSLIKLMPVDNAEKASAEGNPSSDQI